MSKVVIQSCAHCENWTRGEGMQGRCRIIKQNPEEIINTKTGLFSKSHPETNQDDFCFDFEICLETK